MTERYLGPMDPPYGLLRDFLLETPDAMERVIRTYFLAQPDDPHELAESDIIGLLVDWLDRRGESDMAFTQAWAAMASALYAARQDET